MPGNAHDNSATAPRWRWWRIDATALSICAALTLVVYLLGVDPLVRAQADRVRQQRELDESAREADDLLAQLTSLKRELAITTQKLADSPLRLQPVSAVNQRIAMITELATQCELQLDQIQPGKAVPGTHYDMVPILLAGTGSYTRSAAFLHQLHTTFPDIGVTTFDLSGSPAEPSRPARFRFDLAWFAAPIDRVAPR